MGSQDIIEVFYMIFVTDEVYTLFHFNIIPLFFSVCLWSASSIFKILAFLDGACDKALY